MAKARRETAPGEEGRNEGGPPGRPADPLGGLIQVYRTSLAGAALACAVIGAAGLGALGYALSRRPHPLTALLIGAALVLFALWSMALHLFNAGRRLEIRKRGVRFVERGRQTVIRWDDVEAVEVDRHDNTNLGVASAHRRDSALMRRSGPLTKTDWDVTIRGASGQTIRLRPSFLQTVRDPRALIIQLRRRAGLGLE